MSTSSLARRIVAVTKIPWNKKAVNNAFTANKTPLNQATRQWLHGHPDLFSSLTPSFVASIPSFGACLSLSLFIPFKSIQYVCKEEVPLTERKRHMLMTRVTVNDNKTIKSVERMHKPYLLPEDSKECKKVRRILLKLLRANPEINENKSFENWELNVVKDKTTKNIPLLSNGRKYVNQGYLEKRSRQEVATMLSSEAAENVLSHKAEKRSYRWKLRANAACLAPVAIGAIGAAVPGAFALAAYGAGCALYGGVCVAFCSFLENRHGKRLEDEARTVGAMFVENAGLTNKEINNPEPLTETKKKEPFEGAKKLKKPVFSQFP